MHRGPPQNAPAAPAVRLLVPHARAPLSAPPDFDWTAAAAAAPAPLPETLHLEHVYGYALRGTATALSVTVTGAVVFAAAAVAVVAAPPSHPCRVGGAMLAGSGTTPGSSGCAGVSSDPCSATTLRPFASCALSLGSEPQIPRWEASTRAATPLATAALDVAQDADAAQQRATEPGALATDDVGAAEQRSSQPDRRSASDVVPPVGAGEYGQWMQRHFRGHGNDVTCLCLHPDSTLVATGQVRFLQVLQPRSHRDTSS